ncbi:MAG: RNA methyltransferase [Clostridiales bacterium]|nr:RNA methyltransferase [Clostridiales bacterium]
MINVTENITSRKNQTVIRAGRLYDRREREERGEFFVEGIKLFDEAVGAGADIREIFVTKTALEKYESSILRANPKKIYLLSDDVFSKLTEENAPQGIFAVLGFFEPKTNEISENPVALVLDEIGDPGNLGTIIRCADAMNVSCVYIGDNGVDLYNPKTVRACMGSLFRVRAVRCNAREAVERLKSDGYSVYAALLDERARDVRNADLSGKIAFVIGNEGRGVSTDMASACTGSIIIPMKSGVQSLNAAVAASMLMWEAARTRL